MSRFYRHKLPHWAKKCLVIAEKVTLPLLIYQLFRTLIYQTTLELLLLTVILCLFIAFKMKWL